MFLEIFKTGTHTDSQGITGQYSAENLDKIVQNYKNRLSETPNSEAPVVLGHPETSDSAKGWVKSLFRRGNSLIAQVDINDKDFVESLRAGNYKNVSIALDSDLNFIHLGFLGAVPPAVEGLDPLKYSAVSEFSLYDDSIINFNPDLNQKLDDLTNQNLEYCKKIEDYELKMQRIENTEYINSAINSAGIRNFSNSQKEYMLELLDMAFKLDKSSGENRQTQRVKEIIGEIVKYARLSEFSGSLSPSKGYSLIDAHVQPERNAIHLKAISLMRENPELCYEDAVFLTNN